MASTQVDDEQIAQGSEVEQYNEEDAIENLEKDKEVKEKEVVEAEEEEPEDVVHVDDEKDDDETIDDDELDGKLKYEGASGTTESSEEDDEDELA